MKKKLLHVGCGLLSMKDVSFINDPENWEETRLDIDINVNPDILSSITDMWSIDEHVFDMVYSSHSLEHLYPCDVPVALGEMRRVLKPGGALVLVLPDVAAACKVALGRGLNATAYTLPTGQNITPIDILWGWREATAEGNEYMAHKCGFTADTLRNELECLQFKSIKVTTTAETDPNGFDIVALAVK